MTFKLAVYRYQRAMWAACCLALLYAAPSVAQRVTPAPQEPAAVAIALNVKKVTVDAQGKEVLVNAPDTKPGDLLEYTAIYTNQSGKPVKDVVATLPVPANTLYASKSAKPAGARFSAGGDFGDEPLTRKVKNKEGVEKTEPVPYADYRSVRWRIATLDAGRSATVSARVKVTSNADAVVVKP